MLITSLILTPLIGILLLFSIITFNQNNNLVLMKKTTLFVTIVNLSISLFIFMQRRD